MASDSADVKQILLNYYVKCLHIILESRIPSFTSLPHHGVDSTVSSNVTTSLPSTASLGSDAKDCWFNLLLGEFGPRLENLEPCCVGKRQPMVIDVLLSQSIDGRIEWPSGSATGSGQRHTCGESKLPFRGHVHLFGESKSPTVKSTKRNVDLSISSSECTSILERWVVQFESPTLKGIGSHFPQISTHPLDSSAVYERTVIMLRSLYCTARLLPAHNLFRNACSSRMCSFTLSYRISLSPPFSEYRNVKDMILHNFTPVESLNGRMCLSVLYQQKIPVAAFETPPILAQIFPDYVGSPATNPLQPISNDWRLEGPSERKYVYLLPVPKCSESSPACFYNYSGVNNACFLCKTSVARKGKDHLITPHFINCPLYTRLPSAISIESWGHADAEDEELPCLPALGDRISTVNAESYSAGVGNLSDRISQNAAIGTLVRMLKSAAPLSYALQHPPRTRSAKSPETSWRNADRGFCLYLSDKDEMYAPCDVESINPVVRETERQPKKTMALALQELQVYKEMRNSLLNQCEQ